MKDVEQFDLIISGGGMVGQTLAVMLSKMVPQLRMAIVERQPAQPVQPASFDERVLALSAGSVSVLNTLGVWPRIAHYAEPISDIHVSDRGHMGKVRMHAHDYGLAQLGAVIAAHQLGEGIETLCTSQPNVTFFRDDTLLCTHIEAGLRVVELASKQTLATPLLVVAEGGDSPTASQLRLHTEQYDYQQHAVITNLVTHLPHDGWAFERFTENGPIALLPMTDNRRALVWTVAAHAVESVMALDDDAFIARLQNELGYRAGEIVKVGKRSHYPLTFRYLSESISERAVVLGNAAHAVHPIAGQGFNLGLRDVLVLAEQIRQASIKQDDIGNKIQLEHYHMQRQRDQQKVVQGTHLLALGFASHEPPAQLVRNMALIGVGRCAAAKRALVAAAAGVHYRLVEGKEGLHAEF